MSAAFTCTCGNTFVADGDWAGRLIACPACEALIEPATGERAPRTTLVDGVGILPDGDILLRLEPGDEIVEADVDGVEASDDDGPDTYAVSRADDGGPRGAVAASHRFWAAIGVIPLPMPASSLAYGPASEWGLAGIGLNVQILNMKAGAKDRLFRKHEAPVTALALAPDGRSALTADAGGDLIWWDLASGFTTHRVRAHVGPVCSLAIAPDGAHAITGGADGVARLWDLACGCHNFPIAAVGTRATITAVTFSTDKRFFVAADAEGRVDVWAAETGNVVSAFVAKTEEPIVSVRCHDDLITALAAPAVAQTPTYPKVFRWDVITGRARVCFESPVAPTMIAGCVGLDREGWRMLVAGRPPALPFHRIPMLAGAFSEMRDGFRDFFRIRTDSRHATNSLQVMSVNTGARLHIFDNVRGDVISLAMSPSNTRVLAATTDDTLHVYAMPET